MKKAIGLLVFLLFMAAGLSWGQQPIGTVLPEELWPSDPSGFCPNNNVKVLSAFSGNEFVCKGGTWTQIGGSGGSMTWPSAAGIVVYAGSSTWGTSLTAGTGNNNLFQLGASGWGGLCGPTGLLTCGVAGQIDYNTALGPTLAGANAFTGYNNLSAGQIRLPESTVSGLPASSTNAGKEFIVTDGASTCDTTTGGGSNRVFVQSNGTSYVAPNCGSSVPVYTTTGTAVTGAHIVILNGHASSQYGINSITLSGPAAFTNQPSCNLTTGVGNSASAFRYCIDTTGGCTASTGSTIYYFSASASATDPFSMTCVGN